ncbi:uncharacterized protein LOC135399703 [Ornithodoros turicata]|uniref:uncharacterized protein LOC135399703 n=1 Tax=Ornithodoros turicata TaxID=34597 RepID=UPI00313A435D
MIQEKSRRCFSTVKSNVLFTVEPLALFDYVAALAELTKFVNAEAVKVETNALVISLWTGHVSQVRKGNELGEWAKWTLCNQLLRLRPSRELRETLTLARDLPTWRDFGNYSLEMLNGVIRSVVEKRKGPRKNASGDYVTRKKVTQQKGPRRLSQKYVPRRL